MRVSESTKHERREAAQLAARYGERLARPIEVECPTCMAMDGERCLPDQSLEVLVGRYHESRRYVANRTTLDRGEGRR